MTVTDHDETTIALGMSWHELRIIHQALNEVCNGLSIPDFASVFGVAKADVEGMLERTSDALEAQRAPSQSLTDADREMEAEESRNEREYRAKSAAARTLAVMMRIAANGDKGALVTISLVELCILVRVLHEVRKRVDVRAFHARMSAWPAEADQLLEEMRAVIAAHGT
jgi:hypothetical protein